MIHLSTSLKYYKREDVQSAIVEHGRDKEVAARFNEQFGKRPDMLTYPGDVLELAKQGATSFHCSEELWANPLQLVPQMPKAELDKLRKGWDLLLDIDTDVVDKTAGFEYSKIAADMIVKELKLHGVKSVTAKFSGNKGFHVAVPYEAFPNEVKGTETRLLFPEAPKKIASYLKERIRRELGAKILLHEKGDYAAIARKTGKDVKEFVYMKHVKGGLESEREQEFNAAPFLVIDTMLISSRHMYRMPYSLHEKSGLVSVPVDADKIMGFSKEHAAAEKVKVGAYPFMERKNARQNEAERLFLAAYDFGKKQTVKVEAEKDSSYRGEYGEIEGKIPEQYFPPCIKKMLEGVADGKKRALFVLVNFLSSCNWGSAEIETLVKEWNQRNREPLPHLAISSHLNYHKQQSKKALPPNCSNASYYKEIGIECTPECGNCKNPVAEAKQIYRRAMRVATALEQPKKRKRKKDDSNL
ncbi:hypothetical protein HYV83_06050 [Candidatus Woesearchaeota archaeon]|nr:hypothetical protein [Candidatus Woesearchaeota archaeon]